MSLTNQERAEAKYHIPKESLLEGYTYKDMQEARQAAYIQGLEDAGEWVPIEIDYNNIPTGENLLLTTSKVWIIGDWYKDGWRTHRSYWVPEGEKYKLFHPLKKEDVTHYLPLPNIMI